MSFEKQKIQKIIDVLLENESSLSDGYGYSTGQKYHDTKYLDKTLTRIAIEILRALDDKEKE